MFIHISCSWWVFKYFRESLCATSIIFLHVTSLTSCKFQGGTERTMNDDLVKYFAFISLKKSE